MQSIHDVLKKYWGFDGFRPLQAEIIENIIAGRDTFVLLPTGGGKSLCYQVPAIFLEGITIVISPLIALMKDQISQLRKRGIVAEAIYSGMRKSDIDRILDNCVYGDIKLLYISPERLMTDMGEARIKKMKVSFVAVDEAHCISQWGHDFRPPYLEIAKIRDWHPNIPIMALTATATSKVKDEIIQYLTLKDFHIYEQSFARNNLNYLVFKLEDKIGKMKHILSQTFGSAIVYVRNRRKTKEISDWLNRNSISAEAYHAGLAMEKRSLVQQMWIDNKIRVIVATNAFGMGIDKPDVRTVIHYGIPPSLEEYYQEAGRAGRDGKTGYCIILYHPTDIKLQMEANQVRFPSFPEIKRVYKALSLYSDIVPGAGIGTSFNIDISAFSKNYELPIASTYYVLKILEQDGWLILSESIHSPSRAKIIVGREVLYDYQLKNKESELITKLLMRGYEGIIHDMVRINENSLAQRMNVSVTAIHDHLQKLQRNNIIKYDPASDQPKIIYLRDRVETENLTIDQKRYRNQKDRTYQQLKCVTEYLDTIDCRENFLVGYFGEIKKEICGHCDTCRKRKQQQQPSQAEIISSIGEEGIRATELVSNYSSIHEKYIKTLLQYMEGEKLIYTKHDYIFLPNTPKS